MSPQLEQYLLLVILEHFVKENMKTCQILVEQTFQNKTVFFGNCKLDAAKRLLLNSLVVCNSFRNQTMITAILRA